MKSNQSEPSSIAFILFASIFSVLSILYLELGPRVASKLARPMACLVVEGINTIFYFAGFIAFAVFLSGLKVCTGRVCNASQADSAIAAVAFCAWAASTIITAKALIKGSADGPRRMGSQMTQL